MNQFSILLIEKQISVTAEILLAVGHRLDAYTLSITQSVSEAVQEPEPQPDRRPAQQEMGADAVGLLHRGRLSMALRLLSRTGSTRPPFSISFHTAGARG